MRHILSALLVFFAACRSTPPSAELSVESPQLFVESAASTGLVFHHFIGSTGTYYMPEIMGSGLALLDYDLDGDLDVYLVQGRMLDPSKTAAESAFPPKGRLGNRLFENRLVPDGALSFHDATESSGLGHEGYGMGVAVGDYDGDGDADVYVTNFGPNVLYRNNGDKTFSAVPGPQDDRWSTSAVFLDYDGDADLDLFFTNYVDFTVRNNKECFDPTGSRDYCAPTVYRPVPDRLFRNDDGKFVDVSTAAGLGNAFGNGLGVTVADFNNDGRPDIYVANDGTANQLWFNQGDGTFEEQGMSSGAAVNADGRAEAGMGVSAADFDNDGDEDLFMTHLAQETNTLYLNNGNGSFRDATNRFGLAGDAVPFTGFGLQWRDFDLDGKLDLFIANGGVTIMEGQRGSPHPFLQHNLFYRGVADRFDLVDVPDVWGALGPLAGRGLAAGDIDNDGDPDVVISNNNGPVRMYLNQSDGKSWLKVKPTADASGSRVGLTLADGSTVWRRIHRDGSYLSSSEAAAFFGLAGEVTAVEMIWADGLRERYPAPSINSVFHPAKGSGTTR